MNEIPDIESARVQIEYTNQYNPSLRSPNTPFEQPFYHTRDTFTDVDVYKAFLDNVISRFRHSKTYTHYKHYLYEIGLNKCQLLGQIDNTMATIEMHHNFLNIFDIALLITENYLNTIGYVSTFDVVQTLKEEHKNNNIPIVMLSKTAHQLFHNSDGDIVIPARMCFGYWLNLLQRYRYGITIEIANKVIRFLKESAEFEQNYIPEDNKAGQLLALRDQIQDWSYYNEYGESSNRMIAGVMYDTI